MNDASAEMTSGTPIVVIHAYDEAGTCAFCRKETKEGVYCTFDGGRFDGFLCRNDFWKFLRLDSPSPHSPGPASQNRTPQFDRQRAEASV